MKQLLVNVTACLGRFGEDPALSRLRVEFLLALLAGAGILRVVGGGLGPAAGQSLGWALYGVGTVLAAAAMHRSYPHFEFGLCNLITMTRLALTASLAMLLGVGAPLPAEVMWLGFAVAVTALLLDGVDGWAARRAGLASRFGAGFDMEVDSLFALVLAVLAYQSGQAGLWVLALGLPRYLFQAAGLVWPRLTGSLPERFSRKAVCVLQIGTLVAFLVPILPQALLTVAAAVSAAALIWSFALDIRHLTRAAS